MEIIWVAMIRLKHMNKAYYLSCLCVAFVSTCVVDSWDKLQGPPKMKLVDTTCEHLHDGCNLIHNI